MTPRPAAHGPTIWRIEMDAEMIPENINTYWKTTDVQRTWRSHGWTPPSEDPDVQAKWNFFRTLDTEHQQ